MLLISKALLNILFFVVLSLLVAPITSAATLFQENFDSYSDGTLPTGWVVSPEIGENQCNSPWSVIGGKLGISILNEINCIIFIKPDDTIWNNLASNYIFEYDMTFVNGTDHHVIYRYISDNDTFYRLHFYVPVGFDLGLPNGSVYNTYIQNGISNGSTYHIKIVVYELSVKVYIDNVLMRDAIMPASLSPGKIALEAGTGLDPISETWFDNIVVTSIDSPPTNKDQCKKDGWKNFSNPSFKNQGDCVSYVVTHGRNPGNG